MKSRCAISSKKSPIFKLASKVSSDKPFVQSGFYVRA